jgi:hypothetical protein
MNNYCQHSARCYLGDVCWSKVPNREDPSQQTLFGEMPSCFCKIPDDPCADEEPRP